MEDSVKRGELYKVPFTKLSLKEGLNIREDYGNIKELAESIRENGVKVPLRGYKERGTETYVVVDGHRRFKALEILAGEGAELIVPFVMQERGTNDEQMVIDMFVANDGKPLTPLEQAEGVARLVNYGWDIKDIAKKLGKSSTYVDRLQTIANAPKKGKSLVKKGVISATFLAARIKDETIDSFLEDSDAWLSENAVDENGNIEAVEKPSKKKTAKITNKDYGVNSFKEFKRFSKTFHEVFPSKDVEKVYLFVSDLAANKYDYETILNYFTDGTQPNEESAPKAKKINKKKSAKAASK